MLRTRQTGRVIVLRVRWKVRAEHAEHFLDLIEGFSAACRAEPRCRWFEWTRDPRHPRRFELLEAYQGVAGLAGHVRCGHFAEAWRLHRRYAGGLPFVRPGRLPGTDGLGRVRR